MIFIPTYCDGCSRSALVQAELIEDCVAACPFCGASARVVPGSSFRREDLFTYEALAQALKDVEFRPLSAARLLEEVAAANYVVAGPMLRHVAKALPALTYLAMAANGGQPAVRRIEAMLDALLRAIASGSRESGFVSSPQHERVQVGR